MELRAGRGGVEVAGDQPKRSVGCLPIRGVKHAGDVFQKIVLRIAEVDAVRPVEALQHERHGERIHVGDVIAHQDVGTGLWKLFLALDAKAKHQTNQRNKEAGN